MTKAENEPGSNHVLMILTVAAFLPAFMSSAVNIALPAIGAELTLNAVILAWVSTSYLLAMAMFQIPSGRAGDIYGRKKVFTIGMVIFSAFSLLSAMAPTPEVLLVSRFLQGIGSAMIFSTAVAILTAVFPPGLRGRALGINVTAVYIGLSAGPFLGGILTRYAGWRSIFFFCLILGAFTIAGIFWKLEGEWTAAVGERLDLVGMALYCVLLALIMYGLGVLPDMSGIVPLLAGIILLFVFIKWELHTFQPIVNLRLFRGNRVFAFSNLAALINYAATFAVAFVLSLYLQYILGYDSRYAGVILVCQPLVQAILSPHAGMLSDRIEARVVASGGMAITAVGLLMLSFLGKETGLPYIVASLVVIGIGLALFSSPNTNAVMSSVDRRYYGVASGMVGTMRSIGMMISMAIIMVVISMIMGRVQIEPGNYDLFIRCIKVIFSIMTAISIIGVLASLARGRRIATG